MLVCNVSLRPPRRAIAADVAEAAAALDASTTGAVVFATLVDDPASVADRIDAYLGEIMLEAANAADAPDASIPTTYSADIAETVTAADTQSAALPPAFTTFNPADRLNITLSNGDLTATGTAQGGVRGISGQSSGKPYFEYTVGTINNGNTGLGIGTATANLSTVGPTPVGAAFAYKSGSVYVNNVGTVNIGASSPGTVIGIAIDLTARKIWFRIAPSGNWNGLNISLENPATGTGGVSISVLSGALYPLYAPGANNDAATANFGASSFTGAVPSGFTSGWT